MGVVKKNKRSYTGSGSSGPGLSKSASTRTAVSASTGAVTPTTRSNGAPAGWYDSGYVNSGPGVRLSGSSSSSYSVSGSGNDAGYSPFSKSAETRRYERQLRNTEGSRPGSFRTSEVTDEYLRRLNEAENVKPEEFKPSDLTNNYLTRLNQKETEKPGPFESKYTQQISDLLTTIQNPEKFDLQKNDTYQQIYNKYRDQYMAQGSRAMRDAEGNAAALSGGYGNSYAGTVASQAYDNYLQLLNDRELNISQMALDDYWRNRNDKYNQLNAVNTQDNTDYARYRDEVGDWRDERDYLANRYDTGYNRDYGQYRDDIADRIEQRNYLANRYDTSYNRDYGQYRDTVSDWQTDRAYYAGQADSSYNKDYQMYESGRDQYNREADRTQAQNQFYDTMDWNREQAALAQRNWEKQFDYQKEQDALKYALQLQKASGSGGSGGGGGRSGRGSGGGSGSGKSGSGDYTDEAINRDIYEKNYDYYLNNFENGEEIAKAYEAYTMANTPVKTGRTHVVGGKNSKTGEVIGEGKVMEGYLNNPALDGYRRNYVQDQKTGSNVYVWDPDSEKFVRKTDKK